MRISDWSSDVCSSDLPLDDAKKTQNEFVDHGHLTIARDIRLDREPAARNLEVDRIDQQLTSGRVLTAHRMASSRTTADVPVWLRSISRSTVRIGDWQR